MVSEVFKVIQSNMKHPVWLLVQSSWLSIKISISMIFFPGFFSFIKNSTHTHTTCLILHMSRATNFRHFIYKKCGLLKKNSKIIKKVQLQHALLMIKKLFWKVHLIWKHICRALISHNWDWAKSQNIFTSRQTSPYKCSTVARRLPTKRHS